MPNFASTPASKSTFVTHDHHGSVAPTRTQMDCCASTSPRAQISPDTVSKISKRSLTRSTPDREKNSNGEHLPKHSTSNYN